MDQKLNVYALPSLVTEEELAGKTAVVIDVLRASTTIAHALEAGALEIFPCEEIEEAQGIADGLPPGEVILGGERGGIPVPGVAGRRDRNTRRIARLAARVCCACSSTHRHALVRGIWRFDSRAGRDRRADRGRRDHWQPADSFDG